MNVWLNNLLDCVSSISHEKWYTKRLPNVRITKNMKWMPSFVSRHCKLDTQSFNNFKTGILLQKQSICLAFKRRLLCIPVSKILRGFPWYIRGDFKTLVTLFTDFTPVRKVWKSTTSDYLKIHYEKFLHSYLNFRLMQVINNMCNCIRCYQPTNFPWANQENIILYIEAPEVQAN
jgi:hypothetical protein